MKTNAQSEEILNLIKIFGIITLIFLVFLGITYLKTNKKENLVPSETKSEIQYKEVLIGSISTIKDNEFYLLVYEKDDYNLQTYKYLLEKLESDKGKKTYLSNLDLFLNKNHKKELPNKDELHFSKTTLIKVENKMIVEFIEGDAITDYLKNK